MQSHNMLSQIKDYFELNAIEHYQMKEKILKESISFLFVKEMNIYKGNVPIPKESSSPPSGRRRTLNNLSIEKSPI